MISIKKTFSKDLIEVHLERQTSKEQFDEFCNYLKINKSISRILNMVFIAPKGINKVDYVNLPNIANALKNATTHYDRVNIALTVCKHRESFLCSVFKTLISDSKIHSEHFSCYKDAIRWMRRQNNNSCSTHQHAG